VRRAYTLVFCTLALGGCGGSSSSSAVPSQAQNASVRFAEGAPVLDATPSGGALGTDVYLQVNGNTIASSFDYGTFTPFVAVRAGTQSVVVRNDLGYALGPLKTPSLTGGDSYTLILVGSFPNYSVLVFPEPKSNGEAQLSYYAASPSVPQTGFGTFRASSKSDFKQLGTAKFGSVATVTLGKSVTNVGGFVGTAPKPIATMTPAQINGLDSKNALPYYNAYRLSLFLFDPTSSGLGPIFGALDQ